jgi:ABC-type transport system involved in multi-copper enzyme maturation permease subunit
MWHGALAVFRFEVRRTLTPSRCAVWMMLMLFPVFIVSVMKYYEDAIQRDMEPRDESQVYIQIHEGQGGRPGQAVRIDLSKPGQWNVRDVPPAKEMQTVESPTGETQAEPEPKPMTYAWGAVFFGLIPEVITLFGLLLWVPPLVHAELEGRTWIYLAVRPRGRVSVLLGKYMTAVAWTTLAGWTSATVCVLIARPENGLRLWCTTVALVAISSISYGAIYGLFGVWLHRRAMVLAVAYTLIFELLVSLIPAVINKFTVQYRLRGLFVTWMDWRRLMPEEAKELFLGNEPAWLHLTILAFGVVVVMSVAVQLIQRKEYATASDN